MSLVGLHTALSGIRAARVGMDTTAHNVSNANTEGYTRQRVELATSYPSQTAVGKLGTGVSVTDIARIRDTFLDQRVRSDLATGGELDVRADLLARTEALFGEPEDGLTAELNELWASFEELSLRPDDRATRRQVVSALQSLEARVHQVAGGLETLRADTEVQLGQAVAEVNGLLERVAELNGSILDAQTGPGAPNDLLDERDRLLDELTQKIGARVTLADDGTARVSIAGMGVVSGTTHNPLTVESDGGDYQVIHPSGSPVVVGGEVAGMQRFLREDMTAVVGQLDGFLGDLAAQLNDQHAEGVWFDGAGAAQGGTDVFDYSSVTRPSEIQTSFTLRLTNPDELAAAGGTDPGALDGSNAAVLAALRTAASGGGAPVGDRLRTTVTELAANVQAAERRAVGQQQLSSVSRAAREGMHGVSIDEEMVSMLSHQRALEASSRVMSAVDQALDVLINRTGIVGR